MNWQNMQKGQEDQFGTAGEFHSALMTAIWIPAADVAILLVMYSYRKLWVWVHGAFFLLATIYTLSTALPILFSTGIIPADSKISYKYPTNILNLHYLVGIACLSSITFVTLLGITTKLMNVFQVGSKILLVTKKMHKIMGYIIVVLCKVNVSIMTSKNGINGLVIAEVAFMLVLVIVRKLVFPKMQAKQISPDHKQSQPVRILSLKELPSDKSYVVFANYVYDIEPLKINHPAGFQIVNAVKNREVDRFIYGSYSVEELSDMPQWSHSYRSFTLLDEPIARITIQPTFQGFNRKQVECLVPKASLISEKSSIYTMYLFKKQGKPFKYCRYNDATQLGRYFSLTINDKVTRLYTEVNFLVDQNVSFLRKHLNLSIKEEVSQQISEKSEESGNKNERGQLSKEGNCMLTKEIEIQTVKSNRGQGKSIPIMFKHYPKGKLTQLMINGSVNKVLLSISKGEGLQLHFTKPGKILMIVGGTGLFPFCDLIDLLYKEQLILENPQLKEQVLSLCPILIDNPLGKFIFQMLAAFNQIEDIHEITLKQMLFLAERNRIRLTFKFKQDPRAFVKEGRNIHFAARQFEEIIADQIQKSQNLSKILICGPPKMNQAISQFLRENSQASDLYLLI